MSVSIVTVANLGEKSNLKTAGILPVIEVFEREGKLKQVICQISKNFHFKQTTSAMPVCIRYPIRFFEKLFGISFAWLRRLCMDTLVQWKLQRVDIVFFHPATRFRKAVQIAKENKSIVVGIATVAHPLADRKTLADEHEKFGATFSDQLFAGADVAVSRLDYVVAYSDYVRETYIKNGFPAEKIFVAYSDIPITPFVKHKNRMGAFRVLYVAYTDARKGLQYLLDAWKDLNLPNAELVLVGKYSRMPEEMKKYCDDTIYRSKNITWAGSRRDTETFYKKASVFVLPSLTEGNPKVVMEAMAHGLPVITTPNAQSIVEDGKSGFVVPIRDPQAIKEKIQFFYNNPEKAREMGQAARKAMEHKKPFGEAVFEIYQEIMERESKRN